MSENNGKKAFGVFFVLKEDGELNTSIVNSQNVKETHKKLLEEISQKNGIKIPSEKKKELLKEFQKILDQI